MRRRGGKGDLTRRQSDRDKVAKWQSGKVPHSDRLGWKNGFLFPGLGSSWRGLGSGALGTARPTWLIPDEIKPWAAFGLLHECAPGGDVAGDVRSAQDAHAGGAGAGV